MLVLLFTPSQKHVHSPIHAVTLKSHQKTSPAPFKHWRLLTLLHHQDLTDRKQMQLKPQPSVSLTAHSKAPQTSLNTSSSHKVKSHVHPLLPSPPAEQSKVAPCGKHWIPLPNTSWPSLFPIHPEDRKIKFFRLLYSKAENDVGVV